ncbi:hypothetical protein BGZ63DRAFT_403582 [Mariannaea sp. PMI_226]|nr:hypothetical protein BGZ63DRAFT_403582 [Mariannaea sp. PMI_226]
MKTAIVLLIQLVILASFGLAGDQTLCRNDDCARYVTTTDSGIASRRSECSRILATTIKPPPFYVTTTVTKYVTKPSRDKRGEDTGLYTTSPPNPDHTETVIPRGGIYRPRCAGIAQFSSACRCWTQITAQTTTLTTPTVTLTTTQYLKVACTPAATSVSGSSRFQCSVETGMCSCLRPGSGSSIGLFERSQPAGLCVRVAANIDTSPGWGANVTGPCATQSECDAEGACQSGYACVYDGSCPCGKRRCYAVVPGGCDRHELASVEIKRRKRALQNRARDYL